MSSKQRKTPKPLPAAEVIRRIRRMIKLIDKEVRIALEVRASLEVANTLVRASANKHYDAANCVNSIQGSQAMFLSLTLAKLFEMPRRASKETYAHRYNRSDAASIPLLLRLIRQKRARAHLVRKARRWTPMLPSSAATNARDCDAAIDRAIGAYDALRKAKGGRSAILRLRSFRNNLLAHLLVKVPRSSKPTYAQIFRLMDTAREVVGHAWLSIDGRNVELADHEQEKVRTAKAFWEPALPAAMAADAT